MKLRGIRSPGIKGKRLKGIFEYEYSKINKKGCEKIDGSHQ
jgi:hypothetical protein